MAEKPTIESAQGTYSGFLQLFKWGSIATAIVAIFVVLIIAN